MPPPAPAVPVSAAGSAWGNPESPSSWSLPLVISWKLTPVSRNDSAVVNLQHNV
ncbi:rCG49587, partial [Rattus norvegicus]